MTDEPNDAQRYADGGGVLGLFPLLVLQDLMTHINVTIRKESRAEKTHANVEPDHILDLGGGTSIGALIAIMLGKLEMTLEQCIHA